MVKAARNMRFFLFSVTLAASPVVALAMSQTAPVTSLLEEALKPWVPCLHTEAQRLKDTGVAVTEAVNGAYKKCGDGNASLKIALSVLEKDRVFTANEKELLIEGVSVKIREQVIAGLTKLPRFSFRELVAGPDFDLESPGLKKCKKSSMTVVCTELFDSVAGAPAITSYTIYNRKLAQFWISTDRENFPTLLLAFNEKYGKPCASEIKQVQNKIGNTFQSAQLTWCFATGKMIASEIGSRITHSNVIYTDNLNSVPLPRTQIDF